MAVELRVCDDPAAECAELLVKLGSEGGHLVLAGGSTPRAAYEAAASRDGDWGRATLWFGDERCVDAEDDRSNFKMVKESLLDRLSGPGPQVHRIAGEKGAIAAADAYEQELRDAGPPEFDLVLLGLGPDGHTASLFPDQATLSERERLAVGVQEPGLEPYVPRVTLTFPVLGSARQVVFLVSGQSKAGAVAAAFGPDAKPSPHVPASMLAPFASEVVVLLDEAASSGVPGP